MNLLQCGGIGIDLDTLVFCVLLKYFSNISSHSNFFFQIFLSKISIFFKHFLSLKPKFIVHFSYYNFYDENAQNAICVAAGLLVELCCQVFTFLSHKSYRRQNQSQGCGVQGSEWLRVYSSAWSSCRTRTSNGLLLLQQCCHCYAIFAKTFCSSVRHKVCPIFLLF